jgi:hypothetical protein
MYSGKNVAAKTEEVGSVELQKIEVDKRLSGWWLRNQQRSCEMRSWVGNGISTRQIKLFVQKHLPNAASFAALLVSLSSTLQAAVGLPMMGILRAPDNGRSEGSHDCEADEAGASPDTCCWSDEMTGCAVLTRRRRRW